MNKKIVISILVVILVGLMIMVVGCNKGTEEKIVDSEKVAKTAENVVEIGNNSKPEQKVEEVKTEDEVNKNKEETPTVEENKEKVEESTKVEEPTIENNTNNSSTNTTRNSSTDTTQSNNTQPTTNNTTQSQPKPETKKEEPNNSSTNSGSTSTQTTTQPQHEHSWTAVYKTINHPAEYKTVHHDAEYTTQSVPYTEVEYYVGVICSCGATFNNYDEHDIHISSVLSNICPDTPGLTFAEACNSIDYYDAYCKHYNHGSSGSIDLTREVTKYRDEQVVVKEAYDEQVLVKEAWTEEVVDHYKCSCGAKK